MRFILLLSLTSFLAVGQARYPRGLVWEDARYDSLPLKSSQRQPGDLPGAFSIRAYFPRVVNQSTVVNTAATWSLAWYAMTALEKRNKNDLEHKESGFSPAFTYRRVTPSDRGCQSAVSLITALNSMIHDGLPRFSSFTDLCPDSIPKHAFDSAQHHRLSGYVKVFNTFDPQDFKVRAVKEALATGNPVVIGLICPPSFSLATEFWQPREEPDPEQGGHVVCVTAYDDKRYGGAFEVINSWGTSWGSGGYTWIRYDDFFNFVKYGFELFLTRGPVNGVLVFSSLQGDALAVRGIGGHYQIRAPMRTGDKLQVRLSTEADVFGSVLFIDANQSVAELFPLQGTSTKLVAQSVTLPDRGRYYTLTRPTGLGRFILIVTRSQSELEALTNSVKKGVPPLDLLGTNHDLVFDPASVRFASRPGSWVQSAITVVDFEQE